MFGGKRYHKLKLESFGGAVPLVSVRVKLFVLLCIGKAFVSVRFFF